MSVTSENSGSDNPTEHIGPAHLVQLSRVEPQEVRWLWEGRIPLGKLTMLDGDPGLAKSTITLDLAARLSVAATMPDGTASDISGPAGTVLLTAEDGLADTIRPRLDAAGAQCAHIVALKMVDSETGARLPTVQDVDAIREAVEIVDAALVVVDPLVAYLGSEVNTHRDSDVREGLHGLAELAEELGVAILAVRHLNKSGGSNPKYRGGGSIGLIAAARSGLLVAEDPEDSSGERRVLASTKSNLCPEPPALSYQLETLPGSSVARVAWEGESSFRAWELLEVSAGSEASALDEAKRFLREELIAGPMPATELKRAAANAGISWRTVERAKKALGVESVRHGFGADGTWRWELPDKGRQDAWRSKGASEAADKGDDQEIQGDSESAEPIDRPRDGVTDNGDRRFEEFDSAVGLDR